MTTTDCLPGLLRRCMAALAQLMLALLLLVLFRGQAAAGDGAPLVLAVHPYLPTAEIRQRFQPLANYLAREMGRPVSVRIGRDYEEHIRAIGTDAVDIAFIGPAVYINMVDRYGPKPLLARFEVKHQTSLYGVIATRRDSALNSLAELKDKRFAFGDPESTMSHIVPRHMLIQAGIPNGAPAQHRFLGSHKNVAMGVLVGDFDAGAMKKEVFDEFEPKGLRALAVTPGVPDHLFLARATLPPAEVDRLRQALLRIKEQPFGPAMLARLHKDLTALIPVTDADYDALRPMVRSVNAFSR